MPRIPGGAAAKTAAMADPAAGATGIVTIFRSRLRQPAPGYQALAEETLALARSMPGFVDFKTFEAADGERVSIITFDSPEAQKAWRDHPDHRRAQQRGRAELYEWYRIEVCRVLGRREFTRPD
jgi:heme-degrading monooxygenase HmoA